MWLKTDVNDGNVYKVKPVWLLSWLQTKNVILYIVMKDIFYQEPIQGFRMKGIDFKQNNYPLLTNIKPLSHSFTLSITFFCLISVKRLK